MTAPSKPLVDWLYHIQAGTPVMTPNLPQKPGPIQLFTGASGGSLDDGFFLSLHLVDTDKEEAVPGSWVGQRLRGNDSISAHGYTLQLERISDRNGYFWLMAVPDGVVWPNEEEAQDRNWQPAAP